MNIQFLANIIHSRPDEVKEFPTACKVMRMWLWTPYPHEFIVFDGFRPAFSCVSTAIDALFGWAREALDVPWVAASDMQAAESVCRREDVT